MRAAHSSGVVRSSRQTQPHLSRCASLSRVRATHSTNAVSTPRVIGISRNLRTHLIFGANTNVGKTVVSAGLARSVLSDRRFGVNRVHYIKPLQCGTATDESFLYEATAKVRNDTDKLFDAQTLYAWDTPASPHLASRIECRPVGDSEILSSLRSSLSLITDTHTHWQLDDNNDDAMTTTLVETAGGVLSPGSASPANTHLRHSRGNTHQWGWSTQADLYHPLFLPTILIGDGRLGGIGSTISALESLILRGYDVHAIIFVHSHDQYPYGNDEALREYASRTFPPRGGQGQALFQNVTNSIISLPSLPTSPLPLEDWYDLTKSTFDELNTFLNKTWSDNVKELEEMKRVGRHALWWPFTQHSEIATSVDNNHTDKRNVPSLDANITLIDGASGDNFSIVSDAFTTPLSPNDENSTVMLQRREQYDACASWWTHGVGHGESSLALSAAAAAGRYGHVIFPSVVHAPAVRLATKLLKGHEWADKVFFADDGSTGMEVAIKMGLRTFRKNQIIKDDYKVSVCAQKDCYHGDTLGVMNVAEPSIFNEDQHPWYEPRGLFLDYPTISFKNGVLGVSFGNSKIDLEGRDRVQQVMDVESRLESELYKCYLVGIQNQWDSYENDVETVSDGRIIGSLVIEPILVGAGGMKFIDPLWQRALIDVAKSKHVPVIFDEVASGLYRIGVQSSQEILKSSPDIACYAKLLTGGLVPMSVVLASKEVFDAFLGSNKAAALLHGHSYTAHPVGCVSALHALEAYEDVVLSERMTTTGDNNNDNASGVVIRQHFDERQVAELSKLPLVRECMALGTVLSVTIEPDNDDDVGGYAAASSSLPIVKRLRDRDIYARPLGNVVYIMVSPVTTSREECARLCHILAEVIDDVSKRR